MTRVWIAYDFVEKARTAVTHGVIYSPLIESMKAQGARPLGPDRQDRFTSRRGFDYLIQEMKRRLHPEVYDRYARDARFPPRRFR